jgi:hypothetical protein
MHLALAESIHLFETGLARCHSPEDRALVHKYLAALAPILADAVRGQDVLHRLPPVDRLFGNTWLHDHAPFEGALEKWREFRAEYKTWSLGSMTVNERLVALGLMDDFDRAVAAKSVDRIVAILSEAELDQESIREIARRHVPVA